jgi:hypothetical protein
LIDSMPFDDMSGDAGAAAVGVDLFLDNRSI